MNTYQGGWNRPRKKSLGYVWVILSSYILKVVYITNKKNVSIPEAATRGVLYKKLFLKISQYLQENTCVGVSF